jgi:hypothetical protein
MLRDQKFRASDKMKEQQISNFQAVILGAQEGGDGYFFFFCF